MQKTILQERKSSSVQRSAQKTTKYSRNEMILKIAHLAKAIARSRQAPAKNEYFAWAMPLHCGHFWPFLKCSHFSNISCFLDPFFLQNNFNVFVETFFRMFQAILFFALWPFLAIFKMLSFLESQLFFRAVFCIEQLKCVSRDVFRMSQAILFFNPN